MTDHRSCANCAFSKIAGSAPQGMCRRNAPATIAALNRDDIDVLTFTTWPVVKSTDWCGQWEHRK